MAWVKCTRQGRLHLLDNHSPRRARILPVAALRTRIIRSWEFPKYTPGRGADAHALLVSTW